MFFLDGTIQDNQFIVNQGKATYRFIEKEQKALKENNNKLVTLIFRLEIS